MTVPNVSAHEDAVAICSTMVGDNNKGCVSLVSHTPCRDLHAPHGSMLTTEYQYSPVSQCLLCVHSHNASVMMLRHNTAVKMMICVPSSYRRHTLHEHAAENSGCIIDPIFMASSTGRIPYAWARALVNDDYMSGERASI